jgi:membrane fusion protein, heavy metal efflux system
MGGRSHKLYTLAGLTVAIALAGAFAFCIAKRAHAPEALIARLQGARPLQLDADAVRRAGVVVERIELTDRAETVRAFGTVGANRNRFARVTAPVAGRLVKIDASLGDDVSTGVVLATLESPELAEARTAYQQALTEVDFAKTSLDRAKKLLAEAGGAQKDVLRARSDYERAQAALASAQAKLATLGVGMMAPAGASPALLDVRAPLAGTVVERTAVLGEYAQAYQALFTVADLSTVWVETSLYDRDLGDVEIGASATVTVGAYPDKRFAGKVAYIGSILDKDTRTAMARIEVANPDRRLKPGMFAGVEIDKAARRAALRVPENALVLLQGQMMAFVAREEAFEPRPVEIGERNGGMVIVTSGLEPGDRVVVAGAYALKARLLKSQIGDAD